MLSLCARVLRKMCWTCTCLVAACRCFQGDVHILLLCGRAFGNSGCICGYVEGFQRECARLLLVLSMCARVLRIIADLVVMCKGASRDNLSS